MGYHWLATSLLRHSSVAPTSSELREYPSSLGLDLPHALNVGLPRWLSRTSFSDMGDAHRPDSTASIGNQDHATLVLKPGDNHHELVSYTVEERSSQERVVTWTTDKGQRIQHIIPTGIPGIPYTLYSESSIETATKNSVAFCYWGRDTNSKHQFVIRSIDGQTETTASYIPKYYFATPTDSVKFQSSVRNRRLLNTFDTEAISKVTHHFCLETKREYSRKKPVKVWRKSDTSVTFLVHLEHDKPNKHFQFSLSCLKREAELRENILSLTFNRQSDVQPKHNSPGNGNHKKWLLNLNSIVHLGKKRNGQDSNNPDLQSSSRRRVKIHDLPGDQLKLPDPKHVKDGLVGLEIQFTHNSGKSIFGSSNRFTDQLADAERFVNTCLTSSKPENEHSPNHGQKIFVFPHSKDLIPEPERERERERGSISSLPNNGAVEWWKKLIDTRKQIFPHGLVDGVLPVRIAILDTGIDTTNPYINKRWRADHHYRDFLADNDAAKCLVPSKSYYDVGYVSKMVSSLEERPDDPVDNVGHGTHLAGIVLQVTPDAELYVGRVLQNNWTTYDTAAAAKRVALAILYAVQNWEVQVINLSIGFVAAKLKDSEKRIVRRALHYAREQNVVIFAAAANSGNRDAIAFPASETDFVLSMNSTDGNGHKSNFNPPPAPEGKFDSNFSILGEDIWSTWLQAAVDETPYEADVKKKGGAARKRASGTSQATTIAACATLLIMQFGRQNGIDGDLELETFAGIRDILRNMAGDKTSEGFHDIVPWKTIFRMADDGSRGVFEIKRMIEEILTLA